MVWAIAQKAISMALWAGTRSVSHTPGFFENFIVNVVVSCDFNAKVKIVSINATMVTCFEETRSRLCCKCCSWRGKSEAAMSDLTVSLPYFQLFSFFTS